MNKTLRPCFSKSISSRLLVRYGKHLDKHEFVYRSSKKGSGIAESFLLQSDFVYFIEAIDSNSSMISLSGAFVARLTMMITMLAQMNAGSSS